MSREILTGGELDHGDIIRRVSLLRIPSSSDLPVERYETAVYVVSDGCEIDKPADPEKRTDIVHVVGIFPLSALDKGLRGNVIKNRVFNVFYLPKEDPIPEDCFIDWRTLQPANKTILLAARADDRYLCTITGDLRDEVAGRFYDFFFRHLQGDG